MMTQGRYLISQISSELRGQRLDQALAVLFPDFSRAQLTRWIRAGQVMVDARLWRPRDRVRGGERVELSVALEAQAPWEAQAMPLDIIDHDESLLIINKPAGLVTHPAAGHPNGTLINALLHVAPELSQLPRAGIIHRLDKDTSGLLVVARTLEAHTHLTRQLRQHVVHREYQAIVTGVMIAGGSVQAPIGRHPVERKRMAIVSRGKHAASHYRVLERFRAHTWIQVCLETGRTHQIRVHMSHIGYPIVGDPLYGGRPKIPRGASPVLAAAVRGFRRQALHAIRLCLVHPSTGASISWEAPLPQDMRDLLQILREDTRDHV